MANIEPGYDNQVFKQYLLYQSSDEYSKIQKYTVLQAPLKKFASDSKGHKMATLYQSFLHASE